MPNILDILGGVNGQDIPRSIQSIDPNTGLPISVQGMTQPAPTPQDSLMGTPYGGEQPNNTLSSVLGGGNPEDLLAGTPYASAAPQQQETPARQPRERKSLLDIIGGLADTVASVGGATPLYRTNLDAATERQRQVDLDEMRRQQFEQQQKLGGQTIQQNENALAGDERTRLGEALASVAGSENPAELWGTIAQQANIPPDKAAAIGAALQQGIDPARLAQSFGYAPQAQGSLPKEVQIYRMLQSENPELAPAYLQSLTNPGGMTPYQQAQLGVAMANLGLNQEKFKESQYQFDEKQGGGGGSSDVAQILQDFNIKLSGKEDPVADMIRNSTSGRLESWASMVPGAFGRTTKGQENIGRLQTIDSAVVLAIAGGKLGQGVSEGDRKFFEQMGGQISDPSIPIGQRLAAWGQVKSRLRSIQQRASAPKRTEARSSQGRAAVEPPVINDAAGYNALPSGALYKSPDGKVRRKS